jgi:predicted kinase
MMHNLLERGAVTAEMLGAVAEKLVPFHRTARTSEGIARYGDRAIRYNCEENVRQWQPFIGTAITAEQDAALRAYHEAFYARRAGVMQRRVKELKIRECHSDLRSDAVCFTCDRGGPDCVCVMDCVESNRRIRIVDVARDVSFLSMDLEYRGFPDLASAFVERYRDLAKDTGLDDVLPFYACYNACVRGKVESFMTALPDVPQSQRRAASKRAAGYFQLALDYAATLPPALLVMTCGLSASGKSTAANALAPHFDAEVISSDATRKKLAGLPLPQPARAAYGKGIYSAKMSEQTYNAMFEQARKLLLNGKSVILDATFLRRDDRAKAMRLARQTGAQFACLLVEATDDEVRRRMEQRDQRLDSPSDARWGTYVAQKRRFKGPTEVPEERVITFRGGLPVEQQVHAALARLRAISPLSLPS